MRFNLTPSITVETDQELEQALEALLASGVDHDWIDHLRDRATPFATKEEIS